MAMPTPSPVAKLPPELRTKIYEFAWGSGRAVIPYRDKNRIAERQALAVDEVDIALLLVSKAVYEEALDVFYETYTVRMLRVQEWWDRPVHSRKFSALVRRIELVGIWWFVKNATGLMEAIRRLAALPSILSVTVRCTAAELPTCPGPLHDHSHCWRELADVQEMLGVDGKVREPRPGPLELVVGGVDKVHFMCL